MSLCLAGAILAACGDGGSGPDQSEQVGPIGPIPSDLGGKVAFATSRQVTVSGKSHTESRIHLIDMADLSDRIIYAVRDCYITGLTWAPDGEHLVMGSYNLVWDTGGVVPDTHKLHRLSLSGGDVIIFDRPGPESSPAYSANGRLAYFARWSDDPASGIHIDGAPIYPLPLGGDLAWAPDGHALFIAQGVFSKPLVRLDLTVPGGAITPIIVPEGSEIIREPAVSPDGERIAFVRYGGNRDGQEIWLAAATGTDPRALVTGSADGSPAWTAGGTYVAFSRFGRGSVPGIYIVPPGGGMPQRIVGITPDGAGSMAWTR